MSEVFPPILQYSHCELVVLVSADSAAQPGVGRPLNFIPMAHASMKVPAETSASLAAEGQHLPRRIEKRVASGSKSADDNMEQRPEMTNDEKDDYRWVGRRTLLQHWCGRVLASLLLELLSA